MLGLLYWCRWISVKAAFTTRRINLYLATS